MLTHEDFDEFEVGINSSGAIVMMHIPCSVTLLGDKSLYASFFSRQAESHLQLCKSARSTGKHAAPF